MEKKPQFESLFSVYNKRLLTKHFQSVQVKNDWTPTSSKRGVLFYINHSSWWDSLVLFHLNRHVLKQDGYALMSEEGLTKFPFFKKLGAFPINSSSYTSVLRSLKKAAKLLDEGKALYLFPQGEERHVDIRPLHFQHGASYLVQKAEACDVVPITFYHGLLHGQYPEFYIHIGPSISLMETTDRTVLTQTLEQTMINQLESLKDAVVTENTKGFTPLIKEQKTIGDRWYGVKQKFTRR
ncbi:lysophospholipid acyltransferase family protein [Alteribacter aurantiacus]|uniref:lysophospholipid acyltransferase family protein n=1 Tax=Alteribacter aurantiacus TaxID=254410 RepID=UPI00041D7643|nr:lysophospholipid acyltransferase family protein [Alteribacter aurantiacus]